MACLVEQYGPRRGVDTKLAPEPVFTMCPSPSSIMRGTKLRRPFITPKRLTPTSQRKSSSEKSQMRPTGETPALLHSRCTAPKVSKAKSASSCTWSASDTSTGLNAAVSCGSSEAIASARSPFTSATTTRMPSAAHARANEAPIPLPPPVITATLPSSSCSMRPPGPRSAVPTAQSARSSGAARRAADQVAQVDLGVVVAHLDRIAVEVARARPTRALAGERVERATAGILEEGAARRHAEPGAVVLVVGRQQPTAEVRALREVRVHIPVVGASEEDAR